MAQLKPTDYLIRPGKPRDFINYLKVCQRSAAAAYQMPEYENLFSENHYFHPDMMSFWRSMADNTGDNRWWVAERVFPDTKSSIVGGICLKVQKDHSLGSGARPIHWESWPAGINLTALEFIGAA
jgi:hypothetical protein